ncbi:hypothetical protein C0993_008882, partial [Termitomyces sp. T159_Od127]
VCGTHSGAGGVGQDEVRSLATEIHHYNDGIIAMGIGEFYNKVHQSYAPSFRRDR